MPATPRPANNWRHEHLAKTTGRIAAMLYSFARGTVTGNGRLSGISTSIDACRVLAERL